jgi:hypothetical protein
VGIDKLCWVWRVLVNSAAFWCILLDSTRFWLALWRIHVGSGVSRRVIFGFAVFDFWLVLGRLGCVLIVSS